MPRQFGDRETDQAVLDLYIKCGRVKAKAAKVFGTSRQSFATRLNSISNRWGIDVEVDDTIEIIEEQPIDFEMPAGIRQADQELLDLLRKRGLGLQEIKAIVDADSYTPPKIRRPHQSRHYKLGIISDTHLLDKGCALDELHLFYDRCKKAGITEVVHAGDLVTGQGVYKGQENDLVAWGFDAHLEYAAQNYPQVKGITTYWIGGNHEEAYTKLGAGEFGVHLEKLRPDMVYMGMYNADLTLNGVKIGLHHGAGGGSYALSYKLQKYIEKIGAGQKPQLYVLGHYHGRFYMEYRGVHAFLPACFQWPNNFSVRLGLPNTVGGWIVELEVEENESRTTIRSIKTTSVSYYAAEEAA